MQAQELVRVLVSLLAPMTLEMGLPVTLTAVIMMSAIHRANVTPHLILRAPFPSTEA